MGRIIFALGFLIAILECMRKLGAVTADVAADRRPSPLAGTPQTAPFSVGDYTGSAEVARLLDVGANLLNESGSSFSYVPPLDGTSPLQTLPLEIYSMKFVLFDLQLINLKAFDAVAGSFTVELQMVLHWEEYFNTTVDTSPQQKLDNCTFLCDTTSAQALCCDDIWVPPLRLPGCTINAIQSVTPTPYLFWSSDIPTIGSRRRFWYLNIDATCAAETDFHDFPFDVQKLTIDVINPYASRTWFQLNKGFLKYNVGAGIAGINLNPDRKAAGWGIEHLLVSSSCGTQESWQQTFLTQDYLLSILNDHTKPYRTQTVNIMDALNPDKELRCAEMKSVEVPPEEILSNPADLLAYQTTLTNYEERVNRTLQQYRDCVESSGYNFYLNTSGKPIKIPDLGSAAFDISDGNINRSFGLLDLTKGQPTKVSFQCTIAAVANLTTPGIRITIVVQRFRKFYWIKLVIPTAACVAFTFAAFGLQPAELLGRLSVVVPSAIALTALQALMVSDMAPVAYIAPTTYIVLVSYAVQLLIALESVIVNRCLRRMTDNPESWRNMRITRTPSDLQHSGIELTEGQLSEGQQANTSTNTSNLPAGQPAIYLVPEYIGMIRKCDLGLFVFLAVGYIVAILACTLTRLPKAMSPQLQRQFVSMWD